MSFTWEGKGTYKVFRNNIDIINPENLPVHTVTTLTEETLFFIDNAVESGSRYYYWVQINEHPYSNPFGVKIR